MDFSFRIIPSTASLPRRLDVTHWQRGLETMAAQPEAKRIRLDMQAATCTAPVNIAVIKYWGKRDEKLLLPINSSLSATLHQDQLHAKTTVAVSGTFTEDRIWLNGTEEDIGNKRLQNCIEYIRARAEQKFPGRSLNKEHIRICSVNNFPTVTCTIPKPCPLVYLCLCSARCYFSVACGFV